MMGKAFCFAGTDDTIWFLFTFLQLQARTIVMEMDICLRMWATFSARSLCGLL